MDVKDLSSLLLTQSTAAEEIARALDLQSALNLCHTGKAVKKTRFCQPKFWFDLLNHDLAKYRHYYYIYHQLVDLQVPKNLRPAVKKYYDYRDFWSQREAFVRRDLKNPSVPNYTGQSLFDSDALDRLYLILLNDLPYANQRKVALLDQYLVRFDLDDYRAGSEWLPYWFALMALYAERNGDQAFLESLTRLEDFWAPETLIQICQMPGFSKRLKDRLLKSDVFMANNPQQIKCD